MTEDINKKVEDGKGTILGGIATIFAGIFIVTLFFNSWKVSMIALALFCVFYLSSIAEIMFNKIKSLTLGSGLDDLLNPDKLKELSDSLMKENDES